MRRDNCLLVKDVITTSLEKMLIEKDVDSAVAYVKNTISNLLMNRIDLSLLVITKVRSQSAAISAALATWRNRHPRISVTFWNGSEDDLL